MSVKDIKPGDTPKSTEVFSLNTKQFEWAKRPTHIPKKRPVTLYSIEVTDEDGNPMPYIAHPKPFKDTLN